ncbi:PAS domain S-box protein [Salipaludibacillus daqingensis]|uniref:PAS domain S-box protein n=1 Tax=Salipaludibacillus daqingensis TaxID=3041001 RepID=UPI0024755A9B|nr:PAS domain S-box protein [Salipaludibacillus daqingensis]
MIHGVDASELFEQAFRFSSIGIALVSIEGKFFLANSSLTKMLGYSEEELKTKSFVELTHSKDVHESKKKVEEPIQGEQNNYQMEKRYVHKDGRIIWCLLNNRSSKSPIF